MRFLTGDYVNNSSIQTFEDIPRTEAHFSPMKRTKKFSLGSTRTVQELNKDGYKFMVSRDPYTRLWSGYLDKLFLPDFWIMFGGKIISQVRKNPDIISRTCGHNVSFPEFLEYVAMNLEKRKRIDMHFHESYIRCNPCELTFHQIAKIETFSDDFNLLLDENNLTDSIKTSASNNDHSLEEIRTLTAYNFDVAHFWLKSGVKDTCKNVLLIAERIWKTFQMNGYIGDDYTFPQTEIKYMSERGNIRDYLTEKLTAVRNSASDEDKKAWKEQRNLYLRQAYKNVPLSLRHRIRKVFELDFELFGYDPEPEYVFPEESNELY